MQVIEFMNLLQSSDLGLEVRSRRWVDKFVFHQGSF